MRKEIVVLVILISLMLSGCSAANARASISDASIVQATETPYIGAPIIIERESFVSEQFLSIGSQDIILVNKQEICYAITKKVLLNLRGTPDNEYNKLRPGDQLTLTTEDRIQNCPKLIAKTKPSLDGFEFTTE